MTTHNDVGTNLGDEIEVIVKDAKGFIETKNSFKDGRDDDEHSTLDINVRIPSAVFHSVLKTIQDLVTEQRITNSSINSRDVTDQFIDATTRADTLDASRKALQTLLTKALNVQDILQVQNELNQLTQQFESHKRAVQHLQMQSDMSSLWVHIVEQKVEKSDLLNPVFSTLKWILLALMHIMTFGGFLISAILYIAVWVAPFVCIYLIYIKYYGSPRKVSKTSLTNNL